MCEKIVIEGNDAVHLQSALASRLELIDGGLFVKMVQAK
jgi:hypothetical protein